MKAIRLRNFRDYGTNGKSWVEIKHKDKGKVFVAIILGDEPTKIADDSEFFDIDSMILKIADHIRSKGKK